jgi:outer membrane protein assembly factor BamB
MKTLIMNKNSVISTATTAILIFLMVSSVFIVFSNPAASTVKAQTTTTGTSPTTSVSQTPWPMFGYDVGRDRDNKNSTAPTTGHILWKAQTGGAIESSPAVNYGMVYVGSNDGNVYAFDEETGALIWTFRTGAIVYSSPAAVNNMIYVGSENGQVYCLNAATGALVWNFTTGGPVYSSPLVVNGNVYIGSDDACLYCLNAATGALLWKFGPTEGYILSSPSYADGSVFFGTAGGIWDSETGIYGGEVNWAYMYQLNATTGAQIWKVEISYFLIGSIAVSDYNLFFTCDCTRYQNVYALDYLQQSTVWTRKFGIQIVSSPAVAGGVVYIGAEDYNVYAVSGEEGTTVWSDSTTNQIYSSPAVADGMLYVGSMDDWFYCFNATDGTLMWRMQTGGVIKSSPAIADGNVYVGSDDGYLYCFGYGTPTTTTNYPWPMSGGNSGITYSTQSPGPTTSTVLWVAKVGYVIPLDRLAELDPQSLTLYQDWEQHGSPPPTGPYVYSTSFSGQGDINEWDEDPTVYNGVVYFSGYGLYAFMLCQENKSGMLIQMIRGLMVPQLF